MGDSKNIKEQLDEYRLKYDLYDQRLCTSEENKAYRELLKQGEKLPEDVYPLDTARLSDEKEFCELLHSELTDAEITEYLTYKKLDMLKTIKNCIVFFTVLTVIALILLYLTVAF